MKKKEKIEYIEAILLLLKAELRSISRALNDPRLNVTHTAVQLIKELKGEKDGTQNPS